MAETPAPYYARGNFAPVDRELTADRLAVEGSVPPDLDGVYVRNGPNPVGGDPRRHWFTGDGMLHGVALSGGRAGWYRNRFVRTPKLAAHLAGGEAENAANTNVVAHAGRVLALVENSPPTEVTADLDTVGPYDFGGRLRTPFTAHPIACPATGELHFFGYSPRPPFVTYHRADPDGTLRSEAVEVPGPTMMHAFALSDRHAIFMDLPVVLDPALADRGMPFRWSDDYGARLGLLRRGAAAGTTRWVGVDPCYVFHPLNAFEDGDATVVDVVRYREGFWRDGPTTDRFEPAHLHRWRVGPGGRVREERLDDRTVEFPRADPRYAGRRHRWAFAIRTDDEGGGIGSGTAVALDLGGGTSAEYRFPPGTILSELAFVPGSGAGEGEGWLIGYAYRGDRGTSALVVLDAQAVGRGPVATVWLPQRVPQGFHGNWIPRAELGGAA